jgi:hypothetical protein
MLPIGMSFGFSSTGYIAQAREKERERDVEDCVRIGVSRSGTYRTGNYCMTRQELILDQVSNSLESSGTRLEMQFRHSQLKNNIYKQGTSLRTLNTLRSLCLLVQAT